MLSPCCDAPTYLTDIGPASKMRRVCSACKVQVLPKPQPDDATTAAVRKQIADAVATFKLEPQSSTTPDSKWMAMLQAAGHPVTCFGGNGPHCRSGEYDFWPSTGTYMHRQSRVRGEGFRELLALLDNKKPA